MSHVSHFLQRIKNICQWVFLYYLSTCVIVLWLAWFCFNFILLANIFLHLNSNSQYVEFEASWWQKSIHYIDRPTGKLVLKNDSEANRRHRMHCVPLWRFPPSPVLWRFTSTVTCLASVHWSHLIPLLFKGVRCAKPVRPLALTYSWALRGPLAGRPGGDGDRAAADLDQLLRWLAR